MYFKGKVVGDARYIHKDAIALIDPIEKTTVTSAAELVEKNQNWNVVKIDLKQANKVSFLDYEDFETNAFPALLNSCQSTSKINRQPRVIIRRTTLQYCIARAFN